MTYKNIRKLLVDNGLDCSIDLDVASSVSACLYGVAVSDEDFTKICCYVRHILDEVDRGYTQLVADIVCDCLLGLFEYENSTKITYEDMENGTYDDEIVAQFYDMFYRE